MTENYAVDNTSSHGVAGLTLGAVAGAGAAWGVNSYKPEWAPIKTSKYKTIEDIIKEKKDTFSKAAAKDGIAEEEKTALNALDKAKKDITDELAKLNKTAKFDPKVATEAQAVESAKTEYKEAYEKALNNLTKGKGKKTKEEAKKYIKENMNKDEMKTVKEALDKLKNANKALVEKAKKEGVASHKVVDAAALKAAKDKVWNTVKDQAGKIKGASGWNYLLGAAAVAIIGGLIGSMVKTNNDV